MKMIVSGVYRITSLDSKISYFGSSRNCCQRWNTHKSLLRGGIHTNQWLQLAWLKYGAERFEFVVLEICQDRDTRLKRETFYITAAGKDACFNMVSPDIIESWRLTGRTPTATLTIKEEIELHKGDPFWTPF